MTNVVEKLREEGVSFDILGVVSGESYTNISNYANGLADVPDAVLAKLKRLQVIIGDTGKAELFEKHAILHPDEEKWLFLHEIWAYGVISDEELSATLMRNDEANTIEKLAVTLTGDEKAPVDDLYHGAPSDALQFRELLV